MKDLRDTIQDILGKRLEAEGYDVADLVRVPSRGDRMVRIQTLEEAIEEFERNDSGEAVSYLVQVKPKREPALEEPIEPASRADLAPRPRLEGIYLPDGALNLSYLVQNAEILLATGEYALARNIYKSILQSGERSAFAHYQIARCFEAEGQFEDAQKHLEESIAYHPSMETYQSLAALLVRKNKDQEAAEVMERALNLKDLAPETRLELHKSCGNCWMRAGRLEKAEAHYLKALEMDRRSDSLHCNVGALYLQTGNASQAKRHFQEAMDLNLKSDKALAGMGSCLMAEGDKRLAHDYFARSLEINLSNPTAIYYLIRCAYEIKSYATAARIAVEYVQVAPVNTSLLYSLAGLQFHLGKMDEARTTVRKILDLQPQHTGACELKKLIDQYAGA